MWSNKEEGNFSCIEKAEVDRFRVVPGLQAPLISAGEIDWTAGTLVQATSQFKMSAVQPNTF